MLCVEHIFHSSIKEKEKNSGIAMQSFQPSNSTTAFTCALNPQSVLEMERSPGSPQPSIKILLYTLNGSLFIVATFLNVLIVLGFFTMPRRLSPTYILLCNLVLTDFVIGLTMAPISTMTLVLGDFEQICSSLKAYFYLGVFLGSSSLYTLTCISYDRYLSIKMKNKYHSAVTNKSAYKTIAFVWMVSLVGPIFMSFLDKWAFSLLISCVQVLCLIIIVDCYALSFGVIKRRRREIKETVYQPAEELSKAKPAEESKIVVDISRPNDLALSKIYTISGQMSNDSSSIKARIKMSASREERCSLENPIESPNNSSNSNENQENKKTRTRENIKSFIEEEIPGNGNLVTVKETSRTFTISDDERAKNQKIETDREASTNDSKTADNPERKSHIESVYKDQDILLKVKKQSILKETEKFTENENQLKFSDGKQNTKRLATFSKSSLKNVNRRRPQSLLADVEAFKRSLNTILIIVIALFICYLPFLMVNVLTTLRVIPVDGWYDLAIVIVFFHSCVSPITLCVRIANIRKACWRVLKKMCRCNSAH